MPSIGPAELLVVLVVALLVLGPNKLPDAARQVGRAIGEMRKLSSGFQAEMRGAMKEPVEARPGPGANKTSPTRPTESGGTLTSPRAPSDAPEAAGADATGDASDTAGKSGTDGAATT